MNTKLILNCLPPSMCKQPPLSFSVLSSFMKENSYDVEIIYWNLILKNYMYEEYWTDYDNYEILKLLPYLYILADSYSDSYIKLKLVSLYRSNKLLDKQNYEEMIIENIGYIYKAVEEKMIKVKDTNTTNKLIFGFSSKFNQWIPSLIFINIIKNYFPNSIIVMGGFGSEDEAYDMINLNKQIDFTIFGEGEIPLLELCKSIEEDKHDFHNCINTLYREDDVVKTSSKPLSSIVDLDSAPLPDFDDYISAIKEVNFDVLTCVLPIEASRGCQWNKCKFCALNYGYGYRKKKNAVIVKQLIQLQEKYDIDKFSFLDNNIFHSPSSFNELMENLITYQNEVKRKIDFFAEVTPLHITMTDFKKMAVAGFNSIQVGLEAVSDRLLKKMNKCTSFAHNILAYKSATQYGIRISGNVIKGILTETENELIESINNLHYLRFTLGGDKQNLHMCDLIIQKGSIYFRELERENKLEKYDFSLTQYYLPSALVGSSPNYNLFEYVSFPELYSWRIFKECLSIYHENNYSYNIFEINGAIFYKEYCNGFDISTIGFSDGIHWEILKCANDKVISLQELQDTLNQKHIPCTEEYLITALNDLRENYLLYCSEDYTHIISVINTECINT